MAPAVDAGTVELETNFEEDVVVWQRHPVVVEQGGLRVAVGGGINGLPVVAMQPVAVATGG